MGYIDDDNQIVIHKVQCSETSILKSTHGNRVLSARWATSENAEFPVDINIKGIDNKGILLGITKVISEVNDINISSLKVDCKDGLFDCTVQVYVHNRKGARALISALSKVSGVKEVSRI